MVHRAPRDRRFEKGRAAMKVLEAAAECSFFGGNWRGSALIESDVDEAVTGQGLLVEAALRLPPLDQGRVVAGSDGIRTRYVGWVAVMEGPVEDFVAPGELVLTIGATYDEVGFTRFVSEIADAGASALCVCVGKGAPFEAVPAGVLDLGDRLAFPIIELPWELRFADVVRTLADRLLTDRYAASAASNQLPADLTSALLCGDGLAAVTEATEKLVGRPVVILDAGLGPLSLGPRAQTLVSPSELATRLADMSARVQRQLRASLETDTVLTPLAVEPLGLPAVLAATARSHDRVLGYVLAIGDGRHANSLGGERRALQHAGAAVAIELLRRQSVAEAEARVHGDFLWELGSGQLTAQEIATKATLLGYSLNHQYRLILGQSEHCEHTSLLDKVVDQARRRGRVGGLHATRRGREVMILVPGNAPPVLSPAKLIQRVTAELPNQALTWGIADQAVTVRTLADGLSRARRAAEIGRALHGTGTVSDAHMLEPFFILASLTRDPEASRVTAAALDPLVRYDTNSSGHLIHTLEIYLEELGNTSSASRRLFLNRHSLIYRLRKIEELTGRDLDRAEDRLILDLSLRLRRLTVGA
ncbi:PucR family transcriptional regulator [Rhodococcus sp. NPDC059968]|uniref:PucR family transcriptional regulator n=1 Tax=Rhodococcus sp. NPDC059968 TaxID=3347017 RepID=UPI00366B46C0